MRFSVTRSGKCPLAFAGKSAGFAVASDLTAKHSPLYINSKDYAMNLFLVRYPDKPIQVPNRGVMSIGRADDNDIVISESRVSRKHAVIGFNKPGFVLTDLGSSNGTFLNGVKMAPRQPAALHDWDKIRMASAVFTARMVEKHSQVMDEFKDLRSRSQCEVTEIIDVKELLGGGSEMHQPAFFGDLAHLCPVELLQMIESGGKSGTLVLTTGTGEGMISVSNGHVTNARFNQKSGEEAVYEILRYNTGSFKFTPGPVSAEHPEISESITFLLIEGCRRLDEALAGSIPAAEAPAKSFLS